MLFEFIGGPEDGATRELPDHQTISYVVDSDSDSVAVYSREGSRMMHDGQITLSEYHDKTWFWGFQNEANWPTT